MVAVSPLAIIEGLEKIEALFWEAFLSNNHILSSKDLHDLGTNGGNPDYGSIVSQAGAISRQYHPQIDGIQKALQSSNLSDNRAKELHAQRIEVIQRFDCINQLSKGFHLIKNMQAAQNQTQSPLLGMEAARRVFDSYSSTQQDAVLEVLEQALFQGKNLQDKINNSEIFPPPKSEKELARLSVEEQGKFTDTIQGIQKKVTLQFKAISDLYELLDATRPASTQETLGAMGERAAGVVASFGNALQGVQRFISGGDRSH